MSWYVSCDYAFSVFILFTVFVYLILVFILFSSFIISWVCIHCLLLFGVHIYLCKAVSLIVYVQNFNSVLTRLCVYWCVYTCVRGTQIVSDFQLYVYFMSPADVKLETV